jgi:hypothetical protein
LGTRDVWFRRQLSRPRKKATRSREWPKSREESPSRESCPSPSTAKLVPHLACNVGVLSDRASAQLPKKPSNLLMLRLTVDKMILNLKTAKALDLALRTGRRPIAPGLSPTRPL